MTPTCHCACHGARSSSLPPPLPLEDVRVCASTAASVSASASNADCPSSVPHKDLALLVRRLERELSEVKTRLARVETEVVEVRKTLQTERQLHVTPPETAPHEEEEEEDEEMATEQPLLLTLLDDSDGSDASHSDDAESEASSSDSAASEMEWELEIMPRRPPTTITSAQVESSAKARKPPHVDSRGKPRAVCSFGDCQSHAQVRSLCYRHRDVPPPRCTEPECDNVVRSKGKCARHGGRRHCSESGCVNIVVKNTKCARHGGRRLCSESGCPSGVVRQGKCWRHGGTVPCVVAECTRPSHRAGKCYRHHRGESTG